MSAPFTYGFYARLIGLLADKGFTFSKFQADAAPARRVLLRHDIDMSIADAVSFARMERELEVASTYYVMLDTQLYCVPATASRNGLKEIADMGHDIGLHYVQNERTPDAARREALGAEIAQQCAILGDMLGLPVRTFSFHRPTRPLLDADIDVPGVSNAYGADYFSGGCYISDSNHHWRCGDPEKFIAGFGGDLLQVLTHPFWWDIEARDPVEKLRSFVAGLNQRNIDTLVHDVQLARTAFPGR